MKQLRGMLAWFIYRGGVVNLLRQIANRYGIKRSPPASLAFPFIKQRVSRSVQILLYHRVNDDNDPFFPAVGIARFRKQMELLAEKYHPCSLDDAILAIHTNDIPDNAVVITFDDGYRDNFQNAFPILSQLRIPATIFLATDAIGTDKCLWHDLVFSAFRSTKRSILYDFPERARTWSLMTVADRLFVQNRILQFLWSVSENERAKRIRELLGQLGIENCEGKRLMLSWDEVVAMHKHGISFGSHTQTHPILSSLPDPRLKAEIVDSKLSIEERLHCNVSTFAYPVGRPQDFDQRAKTILKESGYRGAVTTVFGVNEARHDPFELRRGTPWERDLPSFALKLAWYKFAQIQ
jgi:peptidoglycan/xylan/chitin deacetylase (PgdA/CDA1 family)